MCYSVIVPSIFRELDEVMSADIFCSHFQNSKIIYMILSNSDYEVYFTGVRKNQYA